MQSSLTHRFTGYTLVDITATGVTRGVNEHARNQQRNWETVLQTIGLRTQPVLIKGPVCTESTLGEGWEFGDYYYGCGRVGIEHNGSPCSSHLGGVWLPRQDQLQEMVGDHVLEGASTFVIGGAHFDPDRFCGSDLDIIDVTPIPDGFKDAIGKAHDHDVLDGFFTQIMIDTVSLRLGQPF